jgi:hypothetical protein
MASNIDALTDMHDRLAEAIYIDDDPYAPEQGSNTEDNRQLRDALLWAIYSPRAEGQGANANHSNR